MSLSFNCSSRILQKHSTVTSKLSYLYAQFMDRLCWIFWWKLCLHKQKLLLSSLVFMVAFNCTIVILQKKHNWHKKLTCGLFPSFFLFFFFKYIFILGALPDVYNLMCVPLQQDLSMSLKNSILSLPLGWVLKDGDLIYHFLCHIGVALVVA